jgi:2-haloacid dehalogenase
LAIRAVIFDYGNVLVEWNPRNLYRKILPDEAAIERFLAETDALAWHMRNDAGADMAVSVPALIAAHPRYRAEIEAWRDRFGEMISGEIAGSIALLDQLAARGTPLALLTNMAEETQAVCFAPFTRRHLFRTVVVSGVEKIAKPDKRIYDMTLERMGARADETLFIDDSPANIAGAAQAGLATHLFTSPEKLAEALADSGLLR